MAFTESFPVHTLVIVPCVLQLLESGHNMCCQCPEGERADLAHLLQTGFSIIFGFEKFSGPTVTRPAGATPARRCLSKVLAVPLSFSFQKPTRTKLCWPLVQGNSFSLWHVFIHLYPAFTSMTSPGARPRKASTWKVLQPAWQWITATPTLPPAVPMAGLFWLQMQQTRWSRNHDSWH